jgi:hypothetical protein
MQKTSDIKPVTTSSSKTPRTLQPTLQAVVQSHKKYEPKSYEAQDLNEAVARFICRDQVPIFTVDKSGFRSLLSKLNPRYQLPGRKYFTDVEIPKLYQSTKDKVQHETETFTFFASTTDIWTSRTMMAYMSVTVQVNGRVI